jgi:hypothetical protein
MQQQQPPPLVNGRGAGYPARNSVGEDQVDILRVSRKRANLTTAAFTSTTLAFSSGVVHGTLFEVEEMGFCLQ